MPQLGGDLVQPFATETLENAPGIGPSELPKAVFMPGENDIQDQPRQRKTGPLGKEKENGLHEVREAGPASRGASDVEQESQVDASQPEIQAEPSPASFAEIKPSDWQTDNLEPHHRRKTGPLELREEEEEEEFERRESELASPAPGEARQPRRRKTGPLELKAAEEEGPERRASELALPAPVEARQPRRRKTGPLGKKPATGQADYPEINSTTASQPISDDHALYRCLACGKRVIGINKEDHTQRVHGGRDPGYLKLE